MIIGNAETFVTGTLAGDAYVQVHKRFMRFFEGDATLAVVLSELISFHAFQRSKHHVDDLDQFAFPIKYLEDQLCMSEFKQRNALKRLQAANLLTFVIMGKPATRYVALNFEAIAKLAVADEEFKRQEKDVKATFYRGISEATASADIDVLDAALDNMQEPLRGCIHLISRYTGRGMEWSPEAVGLLKRVISSLDKHDIFDYGQFQDAISFVKPMTNASSFVKALLKLVKCVAERAPGNRVYDWKELLG